MPPPMAGALERRVGTPLTLSLSNKVAICVSVVLWTSRAVGGTITSSFVGSFGHGASCFEGGNVKGSYRFVECLQDQRKVEVKSIYPP